MYQPCLKLFKPVLDIISDFAIELHIPDAIKSTSPSFSFFHVTAHDRLKPVDQLNGVLASISKIKPINPIHTHFLVFRVDDFLDRKLSKPMGRDHKISFSPDKSLKCSLTLL